MCEIILFLIFIRPFISSLAFPYANLIYSTCLLVFLLIWLLQKGRPLNQIKQIRFPLSLFILALVISLIFSQDKMTSMKEVYKYITGILLLCVGIFLSYKDKQRAILWIAASGFLISILAIYQYFFGFQHLLSYVAEQGISDSFTLDYVGQRRVFSPFVTPNVLGGYLAMIIPLALTIKDGIWFIIPLSLALLLTKSLGALLSIFLGLIVFFYLQGRLQKRKIIILAAILLTIGSIFIVRATIQKQHLTPIFSTLMRLNYWQDTVRIIKGYPLTGVGPGNFNLSCSRYAHNSYLQIWAEMGILGLISFLWLVISVLKVSLKNLKDSADKIQLIGLISLCGVFLIHNFVDFTFFLPEVSMIWWLILGLSFS